MNIFHGPAPVERAKSSTSSSSERNPAMALITIGKNDSKNTSITFGMKPNPNHTIIRGAMAIFGMIWNTTSSG